MKISEHKLFIILALFFGTLFIFLTPPFQSPDEDSHFKKTYLVSTGKLYQEVKDGVAGNYLPNDMQNYINVKLNYIGDREKKYSYAEFYDDQFSTTNVKDESFNRYSTSGVPFMAYIPGAVGILVSRLFSKGTGSTAYMLYFARVFSMLFSITIVYFAIKRTPVLKKTMTVVALMPMSLYLMSMITYDSILISTTLYLVAYLLSLIYDKSIKKIEIKHIVVLSILAFILYNYKQVYLTLFILVFFIPKEKYGNIKKLLLYIAIIGVSAISVTFLFNIPNRLLPPVNAVESVLVNSQMNYVLSHPIDFVITIFKNIFLQKTFQINSMIGIFGLIDTYLPTPITIMYLLLLLFVGLTEHVDDKDKITIKMKGVTIFAVFLSIFAIFTAMYVFWTPIVFGEIGTSDLTGVQGRYFIPLLFPALMILANKKIKIKKISEIKNYYPIIICLALTISNLVILLRYWM